MNNRFAAAVTLITAARLLLAFVLPLLSDEAYYITWAEHPAWGYYDHPPLVAWLVLPLAALPALPVGFYRLVPVLTVLLVGLGLHRVLRSFGEDRARLVSLIYLTTPQGFFNVLVTTEFPLLLTVTAAGWLYLRAARSGKGSDYLLCGLALGAAVLAKYLAVLLVPGILLHVLVRRTPRWPAGVGLIAAGALPGLAVNLAWNATHCWVNFLVHLRRLNPGMRIDFGGDIGFLASQVLILTPWVIWLLVRGHAGARGRPLAEGLWLFLPALGTVLLYGITNAVGLHWLAAFLPLIFPLLAALPANTLRKALWANAAFSGTAAVALVVAVVVVPPRLTSWTFYHDVVLTLDPKAICRQMERFAGAPAELAALHYTQASLLGVGCGRQIHLLDDQTNYGRAYDVFTDFRRLDGRLLVAIREHPLPPGFVDGWLKRARYGEIEQRGRTFYLVAGVFSYETYRNAVLARVAADFYPCTRVPGRCFFHERYFPETPRCARPTGSSIGLDCVP